MITHKRRTGKKKERQNRKNKMKKRQRDQELCDWK